MPLEGRPKPSQHRDLRRTARTLMSRMGIDSKIAEHALAHVPPGVEKVYNRYDYADLNKQTEGGR
jgi:hypothetical protein